MIGKIGLDTNVALRWLVQDIDNRAQSALATQAIENQADMIHLNLVVLAELVWLASHTAKMNRRQQAQLIGGLLDHPQIELVERDCVNAALTAFEGGGAGFTDHLIAALNRNAGCTTTLTFDKSAARTPHFTLLS